jgi:hypothetical protein
MERESTRHHIEQAKEEILMALTNREHQLISARGNTMSQLTSGEKEYIVNDVSRALLESPGTMHDAFENMLLSCQHANDYVGIRKPKVNPKARKRNRKYDVAIRFSTLLKRTLVITFELTSGSGGYSIHHSLHMFFTVKRSESPVFQLLDQYLADSFIGGQYYWIQSEEHVELRSLLEGLRRISTSGLANLTDRDENGRTSLQAFSPFPYMIHFL